MSRRRRVRRVRRTSSPSWLTFATGASLRLRNSTVRRPRSWPQRDSTPDSVSRRESAGGPYWRQPLDLLQPFRQTYLFGCLGCHSAGDSILPRSARLGGRGGPAPEGEV